MCRHLRRAAIGCAWLLFSFQTLSSPAAPAAPATITACADGDGRLIYTQFDCPDDTRPAAASEGSGALSIVRTVELSAAERTALERLERTLAGDRARRAASRRQAGARRRSEQAAARERCEAAQRALAALAEDRKHGYTAAEDRRFDAQEARWNKVRRADC